MDEPDYKPKSVCFQIAVTSESPSLPNAPGSSTPWLSPASSVILRSSILLECKLLEAVLTLLTVPWGPPSTGLRQTGPQQILAEEAKEGTMNEGTL